MRRKHHRRCHGRFTRLASRYRSLFAFALACLALLSVPGFNGSAHAQSATYRVTEEGTEFSLSNAATSPQGAVTSIKGTGKFSNQPIASLTFTLQSVNTAPSFTSDTGFEADENQTVVGTVAATDPDSGDEVAYAISGGADASKFDIGETTGVLTFTTPPDYESAVDMASTQPLNHAGNNEYIVTVRATGGTAERAMTSEQTITVTVTDVDEPPEAPEAPTVRAASLTSLAVTWTAPANTGPAITGYDVRYKATGGAFTNWNHDSANTTTTITGLIPNTRYYVQVRARNHEGPSDWSESGALPNIIWIMADDLGYGDLGSYGQTQILTPNLDRIASEGMRFTDAYAGSPICAPSRSVLMTGQHAGRTRVWWNYSLGLWDEDVTVAELLGGSGYATALIGKWALGEEDSPGAPWRQGFDHFFGYLDQGHAHNYYPEFLIRNPGTRVPLNNIVVPSTNRDLAGVAAQREDYSHDLFISDALDWIERNESTPFFLYLALTIPHANNEASRWLIPARPAGHRERIGMEVPDAGAYQNEDWPGPQKGTAAMITRMDAGVGQIIDKLKELNIDEQTIVFFTSDNGPHSEGGNDSRFFNSNGPLQGEKGSLHDGGIRVPMIVRWPGRVPAGTVSNLVWYFADFLPTMAELVGFENPDGIDGASILSDLLGGSSRIGDRLIYWWNGGRVDGARWGRWKAVWDVRESMDQPLELFDLHQDLSERNDVASTNQDVATTMLDYMASAVTNETEKIWADKPEVSSVEFTSSPASGQNGAYKLGDVIEVTATFSDGVTVTTTDGTPQIGLIVGSAARQSDYVSGSTTQQLLFQYTVQATDEDTDGVIIRANGLKRNGGRIRKNGTVLYTILTHGPQTNHPGHKVDGVPPTVSKLEISSNPGSDRTYAAGDEIEVRVTFSETVEVEGTPQLRLRVGTRTRTAGYLRGTDTAALVFGYEVADGEEDSDGVSVDANRLTLNGGTIQDEADNPAELDHEALALQAGHQVDGVRPAFVSAAVEGASLTLTYGEALDGRSRPASGDFTVEVEGSGRSVSGVSISGSGVTLFLNPAVEHGDTGIRVSYTVPAGVGANPIRDAVGNQARGLSSRSVTNTTGSPNTAPEITSPSSFDVPENRTVARRLAARDSDPGDEVTGWAIVGGADRSEFSIASDTGELSFREAPDYEAPGDNQYLVTVEVTSGAGARELTAEQTLAVRVTDEREPPGVPEAPTFSGETADSLRVSWREPENTGPPITDYDVQVREEDTGGFTGALHEGPGRSLTLSDLEAGTLYQVQVRATNDEGTSGWSPSGEGMTVRPLTVEMTSGADPPVSGAFTVRFSFSEPVTGFSGSDIETQQEPACRDSANNTVFCDPGIGGLETTDDRVFTATVTPWTDRVAHSYTLRLTVPGGAVRSSVGSKPNEEPEEPLEVRVSPPGAPEPISSIGLGASPGSGSVRLSWNRPSEDGGSPIIRYEVRYQAVGEAWSEWENLAAGTRSVTVGNLVNGREYVFEARAVNALGKGAVETAMAVPERRIAPPRPPPAPRPPGNGDGGGLLFPPEAPAGLTALPGEGAVRLEWSPPASDGGTPILRYEYRLKEGLGEFGEWTPIEDSAPGEVNASGYTVGGLFNGTVYAFELRAVNLVGEGRVSEPVEVVMLLDRVYWSNFRGEDLQGGEAGLEHTPFGGTPQSLRLRFGAGLRFEEDELDGEGEVTGTRAGSYRYRYTSRTTGELSLDYDGGESCELRLTFRGVGAGSYSYRCGGRLGGQGSFRLSGLNRRPEITGAGVFEVAENRAVVGRLEAMDPDEGDGIEGYGIAGGADASLFVIEAETGELLFREAPDYETPGDVESAESESGAGDNEYIVVVEVRSGEGERERKGSRAIRVRVSDEEEPPEITGVGPFEVVENQTRVGRLEAVDQDKQDEIREYGIAGGADGGLFAVESETGELLFREAPDYEDPGDVESAEPRSGAADNEYIVVVEVSSGEGERERKGSRAIRVRVTDEEEPPEAPAAPAVTAEGSDSLKVSWREPENRGPEIMDYEVRYREAGEAGYSDGGHQGTGLTVRLSGLKEGTVYEVQVRAVNEEGMSEWSEPGEGRTDREEADPDDPSDFTGEELEGRRLTLRQADADGTTRSLELRFGEGNRFEQTESGGQEAATRSEGASRSGNYSYEKTGPGMGRLRLAYDDGASCEIRLSFTESGLGAFVYDCGGDPAEGSFRLTTGSLFVPVILSAAGQNQSLFTSELTLTNRGEREARLHYTYTAHIGGGSGRASDVLAPGMQKIETDALVYLRSLGIAIPERGNRIGTLRVEARLGSEVEAVVRTTTAVTDGRAGLAYLGVGEEEGFQVPVYLCGLRQNSQDRSNLAFQNMGAPEEGAITMRTTVYSGEAGDTSARVLEDVKLEPGGFHQYSGLLGVLGVPAQGYVRVERVEGTSPFYAYGVINDQANSDGSFVFPVAASSLEGRMGQTLPVIVETSAFTSELTVTNFSEEARTLQFSFVAGGVETPDRTADFTLMPMRLEAGEQRILADIVNRLRQQGVEGIGPSRGGYAGPLFATAENGDMSGIVIGARTGSEGGGGQYSVFYNAVPVGAAFSEVAWVDALQQNGENRSNLALVNTGEVDDSDSVFSLEIYDGETGLLVTTIATRPIPARGWHQINGILGSYAPETRQGYIRILKVSGENPFLAYGVVNDGGAPGERSGDGAYLPARE